MANILDIYLLNPEEFGSSIKNLDTWEAMLDFLYYKIPIEKINKKYLK